MNDRIKHIIAIASGKGGVGKSTSTVNLALAIKNKGYRVGVLDADIYGPSIPKLLGYTSELRPKTIDKKYFIPVSLHGLQVMSMGFLAEDNGPMIWRGPMIASALMQMLNQTQWNDLDYLLIDMPPGTGDIQLTLTQKANLSGAVIITTPQDLALLDVHKSVEMFNKMKVASLGVIENMSTHICSNCQHEEAIFGHAGGEKLSAHYDIPILGRLPLSKEIRECSDNGDPIFISEPDSQPSQQYQDIANQIVELKPPTHDTENQSSIITKQ